jgi:hypothetical protein
MINHDLILAGDTLAAIRGGVGALPPLAMGARKLLTSRPRWPIIAYVNNNSS